MTLHRRLDRLEARKPVPRLVDIIGVNAEFFMRCFKRVCVDCPDRAKYPHCPRYDCAKLLAHFDDVATQLDVSDEREREMLKGVEIWKTKRDRSEWLAGGFFLFADGT